MFSPHPNKPTSRPPAASPSPLSSPSSLFSASLLNLSSLLMQPSPVSIPWWNSESARKMFAAKEQRESKEESAVPGTPITPTGGGCKRKLSISYDAYDDEVDIFPPVSPPSYFLSKSSSNSSSSSSSDDKASPFTSSPQETKPAPPSSILRRKVSNLDESASLERSASFDCSSSASSGYDSDKSAASVESAQLCGPSTLLSFLAVSSNPSAVPQEVRRPVPWRLEVQAARARGDLRRMRSMSSYLREMEFC